MEPTKRLGFGTGSLHIFRWGFIVVCVTSTNDNRALALRSLIGRLDEWQLATLQRSFCLSLREGRWLLCARIGKILCIDLWEIHMLPKNQYNLTLPWPWTVGDQVLLGPCRPSAVVAIMWLTWMKACGILGSGFQLKLKDLPGWTQSALQDVDSICFLEMECLINTATATTTFHVAYMNVRSSSWAQGAVDEVLPHLGCNPLRRGDPNSFLWFWWVEKKLVVLMGVEKTRGLQEDLGFVKDYLCVDRKFSDLRRERSPILPCLGCCLVCRDYNFGKMVRWMSFRKKWWNGAVREGRLRHATAVQFCTVVSLFKH